MSGSVFGNIFKISTWGESHGKAVGVVVDGCPAGLELDEEDIQYYLNLRKPGQSRYATPRREDDLVEILSGVFEGRTTGTPISMLVRNKSHRSADYSEIAGYYRPGHADYTFDAKYGFRDYRGGGRSSGRETIGRVAAGAIALKILRRCGISIEAYTLSIGDVRADMSVYDYNEIFNNPFYMPDADAAARAAALVDRLISEQDSIGGVIECRVNGVPAGIGDPVFDKLSANIAKAICSIGAVRGFEIGDGFAVSRLRGSQDNDAFRTEAFQRDVSESKMEVKNGTSGNMEYEDQTENVPDTRIVKTTNHSGGLLGGMSDGSQIVFRAAVKPTPSIARTQHTVSKDGREIDVNIKGRHDPLIMPRAVVVVQSMAALAIVDSMMLNMTARMEYIEAFYH